MQFTVVRSGPYIIIQNAVDCRYGYKYRCRIRDSRSRNVGNLLPTFPPQHPTRAQTSFTPRRKPEIYSFYYYLVKWLKDLSMKRHINIHSCKEKHKKLRLLAGEGGFLKPNFRCKRGMTVHTSGLVLNGNPNEMHFHSSTLLLTSGCRHICASARHFNVPCQWVFATWHWSLSVHAS